MNPILVPFLFLPLLGNNPSTQPQVLSQHGFSLENRYADSFVNTVFKDNILLTLKYAKGEKVNSREIDWKEVEKPFRYELVLKPNETFAFHDDVLPEFEGKVTKTTNAHFNYDDGFKSDGYLMGDGVCHLASLLYWVAKDAQLNVLAPTRHDFAAIPNIEKELGVSIFATPGKNYSDQQQNLYVTNNKETDVTFIFDYDGEKLTIQVIQNIKP